MVRVTRLNLVTRRFQSDIDVSGIALDCCFWNRDLVLTRSQLKGGVIRTCSKGPPLKKTIEGSKIDAVESINACT